MKKIYIMFLISLSNLNCIAQNLVPNPSFEDTVACPNNASQIERAAGWSSYRVSPDYYNICDLNPLFGVPYNWYGGYQNPASGVAYAGIGCYTTTAFFREILGIQLIQPLSIGTKYFCSFKVSRGKGQGGMVDVAINKIGLRFSVDSGNFLANPAAINNYASIYSDTIVTDTTNWVTISGFFCADSNYKYVSIGNFFDDANTSAIDYTGGLNLANSYYYIDDVSVVFDTSNCNMTSVSTNNITKGINIFPNPFVSFVTFSSNLNTDASYLLYNEMGMLILNGKVCKKQTIQIFPKLSQGVYYIHIQSEEFSQVKKLIKI